MSDKLITLLTWGGAAVAVVFAVALIWFYVFARPPEGSETAAPVALYWALLVFGVVATIAGFAHDRRKRSSTS